LYDKSNDLTAFQNANWQVFKDRIDLEGLEDNTVLAMDSVTWSNRGQKRPFIPERVHYRCDMTVQEMIDAEIQQPFQVWRDHIKDYLSLACKARNIFMSTNAKKDQLVAALVHYDSQLCVQHLPVTVGRTPSEKEYWEVLNKEVLIERCQMLGLRIDVGQGKIKKKIL
jgi:hypothetical protein